MVSNIALASTSASRRGSAPLASAQARVAAPTPVSTEGWTFCEPGSRPSNRPPAIHAARSAGHAGIEGTVAWAIASRIIAAIAMPAIRTRRSACRDGVEGKGDAGTGRGGAIVANAGARPRYDPSTFCREWPRR